MFLYKALYWGQGVKDNYAKQIRNIVTSARLKLGDVPVIFGECGVPIDLKLVAEHRVPILLISYSNEEAFKTGNFHQQERMMGAMISALEANMVGYK